MPVRRIRYDTVLAASFDQVFDALMRPETMLYVCRPLLHLRPVRPARLPDRWQDGDYVVSLWLFGFLPLGRQHVGIEFGDLEAGADTFTGMDRGRSRLMKRWDHSIGIAQRGDGTTGYFDEIVIDAGWLTPIAAPLVRLLFRHRQKRLRAFAARGFAS